MENQVNGPMSPYIPTNNNESTVLEGVPSAGHSSGNLQQTQQSDLQVEQTQTQTQPQPQQQQQQRQSLDFQEGQSVNQPSTQGIGQSTDFVKKSYQMSEENRFTDIVKWSDKGDSFMIMDTNGFTKEVLPGYFKHSNFSSFVRQLNKYDFHKVKISNESKQRYQLEGVWEFKHPDFNRFDKKSLENIKRKVPAKKETTELVNAANCISITSYRRLEDQVNQLSNENTSLHNDVESLKENMNSSTTKYNTLVSSLLTAKKINESFAKSLTAIANSVTQLGGSVPPLELLIDTQDQIMLSRPNIKEDPSQHNYSHQSLPIQQSHSQSQLQSQQQNEQNLLLQQQHPQPIQHVQQQTQNQQQPQPQSQAQPQPHVTQQQRLSVSAPMGHSRHHSLNDGNKPLPLPVETMNEEPMSVPQAIDQQTRISNRPTGSTLHVLLVEDDDVCIQLCRKFLMKYGCTVVVATDGLSAIEAVKQVQFDLVLMDIVMPNLDGASATSIIRSFDSDTPVIAMTGNYQRNDLVTYLNHGMTDILAKPFTKDDLYAILEKHNISYRFQRFNSEDSSQLNGSGIKQEKALMSANTSTTNHNPAMNNNNTAFIKEENNNNVTNITDNTVNSTNINTQTNHNSIPINNVIPNLHTLNAENIPTPSLLDTTLSPVGMNQNQTLGGNSASGNLDGVDISILGDVDSEFGEMFKRRKV